MKILASAALATLITTAASAQAAKGEGSAAVQSCASDTRKAQSKKARSKTQAEPQRTSPYSTNPEYDVYVRGEYVGSDPDPRVRWTLRQEATRSYGLR